MGSDITLSKAVRANLLSLQNTAELMNKTQSRLATGNKVNSALDNPSNFFTAASLNSRAADMSNLLDAMASGVKVIEAANNGLTALTKNLESMQSTLRQARQDKTFQTKSFDVSDNTVIKLGGGQFGDSVSEISLAAATQAGTKAQITTSGTSAYLGPQSSAEDKSGAGARSIISLGGGFATGDEFTVAGRTVTVSGATPTAESIVADIQTALNAAGSDVAGKYTVHVGEVGTPNEGKIIIETVDASAAAAEVKFDIDNDPLTGVGSATKGVTTFNYSAVNTAIDVGGKEIQTGGNFDTFVANLKAGEAEGGYKVEADSATKQITLTSTQWGGAAPEVNGVPNYAAAVPAEKASVSFQLSSNAVAERAAQTSFSLTQKADGTLAQDQALTIAGSSAPTIALTEDMDAEDIAGALRADANLNSIYDIEVDADTLAVTLTAKTAGVAAAPTVTSSVGGTPSATAAPSGGTSSVGGNPNYSALAGEKLTLTVDGDTHEFEFTSHSSGQFAALTEWAADLGFTIGTAAAGITISRLDAQAFDVGTSVAAVSTALGLGGNPHTAPVAVTAGTAPGIVNGNTAGVTRVDGLDEQAATGLTDSQKLTIAGKEFTLTAGMTADDLETMLADATTGLGADYKVEVGADFNVTITALAAGDAPAPLVNTDLVGAEAVASSAGGTSGADFNDNATFVGFNGESITLDDGSGPVTYAFTSGTGQLDAMVGQFAAEGFSVNSTGTGLEISRADGKSFTITMTGGLNGALGLPTQTITVNNGTEARASGIVGDAAGINSRNGTAGLAEVKGVVAVDGDNGASVETVEAHKNAFTVSYDGKTANIEIGGVKGGIDSPVNALDIKNWQDATIASVNNQLKNQGIDGVELKFDDAGKMQFVAKTAEAKTLALSGRDAVELFGTNGVHTGVAEKSELNAIKTVDKFVELINRDYGGKVRASNDNGKLRIENLSTQELDIGINTDGAQSSLKVDGNSVRANLSKQFNELRDQLDKLADDASFNGINLLRGDKLKITFNESGTSSIDIQAKDKDGNVRGINASNLNIDSLVAEDLDTDEAIDAYLAKLSSALTELRSQASSFGSNLSSVENRQSFTKNMINTLETGAANLTLADTNEEAANLLALQTRQQLSSSALSMASQQDQAVLQLLR